MQLDSCYMQPVSVSAALAEVAPLRHASRQVVRELGFLRDRLAVVGLTYSQGHALIELGAAGELTAVELAARLLIDKSTMSRTLAPLVRSRLLVARTDARDERRRRLSLS